MPRPIVAVEGAAAVLAAAADSGSPHQAAQRLRHGAAHLDLRDARAATVAEGRSVVLATDPTGAALALRWFAPGTPTTIHRHGSWGAAVVIDGRDRYERFELNDGAAVLDATLWPEAGDVVWWLERRPSPVRLERRRARAHLRRRRSGRRYVQLRRS